MTIEDSGDVPLQIPNQPANITLMEKKWKPPIFSLDRSLTNIKSTDKCLRLEGLGDLKEALPFSNLSLLEQNECITKTISIIRKCLYAEADDSVKQRIIECLSIVAQFISVNSNPIVEDLINQFQTNSSSVKASLLSALEQIFLCKLPSELITKNIEEICLEQLQSRKVIVRKQALSLLCKISKYPKLQEIFSRTCELDPDPRVRCVAFEGILTLHQRKFILDIDLYKRAVEGMSDDNEQVKLCAVELMWILCNLHPFHVFTIKNTEQTRLVDDGM